MEREVHIVYMDFNNVFHKVPHIRLIWKVRSLGIQDELTIGYKIGLEDGVTG